MRIRLHHRAAALLLALSLAAAFPGHADPVRLAAADDRGVTLELTLTDYQVGAAGQDGRSRLTAPGLTANTLPGRPVLPAASVLVALPPGAQPLLGSVDGDAEETRDGVRLTLGDRRGFTEGPQGRVPIASPAEPIRDGAWPAAPIELGAPFTLRGQRMVAVRIQPFRYDEAAGRLWARRRLRVRVEFGGGTSGTRSLATAPEDRHWDPVLRSAVLNFEQGRRWRTAPPAAVRRGSGIGPGGGSLFDREPGSLRPTGAMGPTGAAPFDESDPEVRVQIDSTGVYALPYDALAAKGFPAGVPIAEVSLHRHEYAEDAIPAYQTIELPIEVDEGQPANGVFDSGDRIVAFVQSWAERSGASLPQRAWDEGEVIYATRVARGGLRIGSRSGWRDATGLSPLPSYPWTQRWEKNFTHMQFPGTAPAESTFDQFHWTGSLLYYYARPETLLFDINDLDPTHTIPFTIAWQGRQRNGSYLTWAQVRNANNVYSAVADTVLWSGRDNLVVTANLPGSAVTEGPDNSVVMWARNSGGEPHPTTNYFALVSLNWFSATYWRGYRALRSYLPCNSGDATGAYEIFATGFDDSTALRAYDVTNPVVPLRLTGVRRQEDGSGFALRLQDSTGIGAPLRYLVFSEPKAVPAARMTAVGVRPALGERGSGDYLLITPQAFLNAVQPLATLRASEGLNVVVSPLEAVFDEFNGGRRSAWALKRYIRFALNNWNARFVLLVGDGSEDPHNYIGNSGPDLVPVPKVPGPVGIDLGREMIASDGWYVWCLNGCEPNPQPPPILPELFIGRLPVSTVQEVTNMVAKLSAYEDFSTDQAWRNRQLLFSDDEYSGIVNLGGSDPASGYCHRFYEDRFRLLNETIRSTILDGAGLRGSDIEHFDLGYWLRNEPVNAFGCRPDLIATQNRTRASGGPTMALFTRLNAGRMWWNYQGHANEFVLAHENFYRNTEPDGGLEDDKRLLVNDDMPFLFSAFSCHANAFARVGERHPNIGRPIGEDLVVMPRRGAIASLASAGYEIIPDNGTDHINVMWARAMFVNPPHDDVLGNGDRGARVVLGETIALALIRYVPSVFFDPTENGIALSYNLLGDPATRISIGPPQAIVTANGDTVISDRPVALAPPRDNLNLEADLVSNVEITSIALIESGSGGTNIVSPDNYTLTPAFPDTGVGGLGGRRYHLSYSTPVNPGVLRYTIRVVDRHGLQNDFNLVLQFSSYLRVSDNVLVENDPVDPAAALSLKVTLPIPVNPQTEIVVLVDSLAQPFTATPTDTTGRGWILRWDHAPYTAGTHRVDMTAFSVLSRSHHFRVFEGSSAENRLLRDVMAFPNPFDDQMGSTFSYYLVAEGPTDVMLRLFTVSGRTVYQRVERDVQPGYHQWPWDGRDAEGDRLANGVYLFKMVASARGRSDTFDGRLVKLRKPRRSEPTTTP